MQLCSGFFDQPISFSFISVSVSQRMDYFFLAEPEVESWRRILSNDIVVPADSRIYRKIEGLKGRFRAIGLQIFPIGSSCARLATIFAVPEIKNMASDVVHGSACGRRCRLLLKILWHFTSSPHWSDLSNVKRQMLNV